ncbi:MAG: prepilin-type N-terminal cleavage/methylation domain-containing protein [Kiritimatiellia bacterium]|jgi:prepilin-type N-terminal cleavage/methylation domain-containing protein
MTPSKCLLQRAFTLIEVLVSLVLVSLMAALLLPIFTGSMNKSDLGMKALPSALHLHQTMENLIYAHDRDPDLARLHTAIGPEGADQNNDLGIYTVVHNRYVYYDDQRVEHDGLPDSSLLKVTIANQTGDRLTRLFSYR